MLDKEGEYNMAYDVENNFTYHKPFGDQNVRYEGIRAAAKVFAEYVLANTPPSREQSVALTNVETAVFWANASIARNEEDTTLESVAA